MYGVNFFCLPYNACLKESTWKQLITFTILEMQKDLKNNNTLVFTCHHLTLIVKHQPNLSGTRAPTVPLFSQFNDKQKIQLKS